METIQLLTHHLQTHKFKMNHQRDHQPLHKEMIISLKDLHLHLTLWQAQVAQTLPLPSNLFVKEASLAKPDIKMVHLSQ